MIKELWAKISYIWFIVMIAIVGFFCGALNVNGATVPTSSDEWASQWCSNRNCDYTIGGSTYYRDYANVNSGAYTNSNSYYLTAIRLRLTFSSSNYLQVGTQYQLRYKLWFTPQYPLNYYDLRQEYIDFTVTNTSNTSTTLDNSDFTCSFSDISGNNSFFLTCYYTPNTIIKQVYLRIKFPYTTYLDYSGYSGYIYKSLTELNYTSSNVSYNSGAQDAIQNQTTTIINQTNEINNSVNNVNNSVNNLNDSINNDDVDDPSSTISDFEDMLPSNGVITQLIALPITLFQRILTQFRTGVCRTYSLPFLNNTTLSLPCINISSYISVSVWTTIDVILSGLLVWHIAKKMVKAFENFTSLKEGDVIDD